MTTDPGGGTAPIAIVGNLNVDQIVRTVTRFPRWDEELLVDSSTLDLAGTAGYVALAAQALGMPPFIVSTIGADANGEFIRHSLAQAGIADDAVVTLEHQETCIGIIFVGPQGQRGILSVLGAHADMDVATAMRFDAGVAACREVFLCGNYLLPRFSPGQVVEYARHCRQRGQVVVFDPGWDPAGWTERTRQETFALLGEIDLYLPNEEEICHLAGEREWEAAVRKVAPHVPEIVIKRGAQGAVHVRGDRLTAVPALPIAPVNTIGAGDIFDASYLFARRQQRPVAAALRFACAAAAFVVAQDGPRRYPTPDKVEDQVRQAVA